MIIRLSSDSDDNMKTVVDHAKARNEWKFIGYLNIG